MVASVADSLPTLTQHWVDVFNTKRVNRTPAFDPMLNQCWATVADGGPTLIHDWVDVFSTKIIHMTPLYDPMLVKCWASVADVGPALNQHCVDVWSISTHCCHLLVTSKWPASCVSGWFDLDTGISYKVTLRPRHQTHNLSHLSTSLTIPRFAISLLEVWCHSSVIVTS